MTMLRYFGIYALAAVGLGSLFAHGAWTFALPIVAFGLIPALELFAPGTVANLSPEEEQRRLADRRYDWLLFGIAPLMLASIVLLVARVSVGARSGVDLVGAVVTVGLLCGALGINVAHELGHRAEALHRGLSRALLGMTLYAHFFVEHNRGHHLRVATAEDPASSRRGEWLYAFYVRSIVSGARSAFGIEGERLRRQGRTAWSLRNEVLLGWIIQAGAVGAVALVSVPAAAAWVSAALLGILTLETINYVEHYGLARSVRADGRPEPVRPRHSWNANHSVGRALLFDLTRHSDHHANPRRPYPVLRHFDEAPQLPTGYPGMMVLAAVPPLFFAVMHRRLDALDAAPIAA